VKSVLGKHIAAELAVDLKLILPQFCGFGLATCQQVMQLLSDQRSQVVWGILIH